MRSTTARPEGIAHPRRRVAGRDGFEAGTAPSWIRPPVARVRAPVRGRRSVEIPAPKKKKPAISWQALLGITRRRVYIRGYTFGHPRMARGAGPGTLPESYGPSTGLVNCALPRTERRDVSGQDGKDPLDVTAPRGKARSENREPAKEELPKRLRLDAAQQSRGLRRPGRDGLCRTRRLWVPSQSVLYRNPGDFVRQCRRLPPSPALQQVAKFPWTREDDSSGEYRASSPRSGGQDLNRTPSLDHKTLI